MRYLHIFTRLLNGLIVFASTNLALAIHAATINPTALTETSIHQCELSRFKPVEQLPEITELPDPFLQANGQPISHIDQWPCVRAHTRALFEQYELGEKPPKPQKVSGSLEGELLSVKASHLQQNIEFTAKVHYPTHGQAPYPVMISIGWYCLNKAALDNAGIAVIEFNNNELGEQKDTGSRGKGKFYQLYGSDNSASAMIAWSWGISRIIDVLAESGQTQIDAKHIGVTGCSRNGKGAIVAGAFDERISLTIAQESGSGGSASWRISDAQQAAGQNVQTQKQIVTENVWFRDNFKQFSGQTNKIPVDHHQLMGLIAPRGLLVIENTSMEWLGNASSFLTAKVAHSIWQALGVPQNMGVSQLGGHKHCQYPDAQLPELNAYLSRFLLDDKNADTSVLKTDGEFDTSAEKWMPWAVPELDE
ncbi:glucuronyl esterase domain-containing protein [Neptunicella sp.]|uniref:glucuronyl esterase domain-containing protein n=1 Tax=Neptunicella sp. TaxID=2125986 RepID=UPI003F68D86D